MPPILPRHGKGWFVVAAGAFDGDQVDVAIVGAGLAGCTAAFMLASRGISCALIDPRLEAPPDFRCEKLDSSQLDLAERIGIAPVLRSAGTEVTHVQVARFGRIVETRLLRQFGILYPDLVDAVRGAIPPAVTLLQDKVAAVETGPERQRVRLAGGGDISARLVVMATGLNPGLSDSLGIRRTVVSKAHSVSIGFDLAPAGQMRFGFRALTCNADRPADRMAYLTLFPLGDTTRANLFLYRPLDDPWLAEFRRDATDALFTGLPRLRRLTGAAHAGPARIRPVDLYVVEGYRQPGIVLVGDAFATSCPAAGSGVNKVFTDVLQLCSVHVPAWLATAGMGAHKMAAFYDDPEKRAADEASRQKAFWLRSYSTETTLPWRLKRTARLAGQFGRGQLDGLRHGKTGPGA
ncbi:2-polyprenyl-6-methoxyphenol hydroxylase [Faunimonas pinastri]|uniref:2-polyprenyl-6-methoxyphenol hydroxylase n=1 Tax=Faunimonas pinastri TaxID=1855383 RepID=A0A1H9C586_9HYPH|nr:NAD(P)/FAD-dependent oxidoreductase [Faunimonas pinastri]SEP96264.1 2-polyprenyl-6-methoxyphenol hydroxylase [Faunimonas pinastri]